MKKIRQVAAWIAIILILGFVVTTFIFGITGNSLFMSMLILTMGVSIVLWAMLWFLRILTDRSKPDGQTDMAETVTKEIEDKSN